MENPNNFMPMPQMGPPSRRSKRPIIILSLILLLLIGGGAGLYLALKSTQTNQPNDQTATGSKTSTKRVVYAVKTGAKQSENRQFITYDVWYADAGSKPKKLGAYGQADKYFYPDSSQLSRDGKTVFLKYDNTLESVSIADGKSSIVYSAPAGRKLDSFVQNQSGTELLVSSSTAFVNVTKGAMSIDRVNLATNKITNEYTGQRSDISLRSWRADNKILFSDITYSEFTRYGVYDLETKAITDTADGTKNALWAVVNTDGTVLGVPNGSIPDVCNGFSGSSTNSVELLNPITQKTVGEISSSGVITNILIGNSGKVIVTTQPLQTDRTKCEFPEAQKHGYAVYDIAMKKIQNKASYREAYSEVFSERPFIEATLQNSICTLVVESQSTLSKPCTGEPEYIVIGAVTIPR